MTRADSSQRTQGTQRSRRLLFLVALVSLVVNSAPLFVMSPAPLFAQMAGGAVTPGYKQDPGLPASAVPKILREIGFDQNLGRSVPLDIPFVDEQGRAVRFGDYFDAGGTRPVVLALVYFDCPMLCTTVLNSLTSSLKLLSLDPGKDFDIVVVSFDPREKPALAAAKKATYLARYKRPGTEAGWHFLTGAQPSIDRLTKAVGFRYVWDEGLKQFAHPTGITVLTPQGRLSRYLFGVEYGPRDLRFAIVDASAGKVGNPVDQVLLYCYHYDPETGRYGLVIMRMIRLAGAATVLALAAFIVVMVRRERHQPPDAGRQPPAAAGGA
jgi:protein SCO1/2